MSLSLKFLVEPLLRPTVLLLDESLPSYLTRLVARNFYDQSILRRLCGVTFGPNRHDKLNYPTHPMTYERLSIVTETSTSTLHAATMHRFASVMTPPDVEFESVILPNNVSIPLLNKDIGLKAIRNSRHLQFCPDCLKEGAYHRVAWMPVAVSACLAHRRLLVHQCPACHDAFDMDQILAARCTCGFKLTRAASPSIADDPLGLYAQQTIQAWFGLCPPPVSETYQLPDQPPRTLYRVLSGLTWATAAASNADWDYLHWFDRQAKYPAIGDYLHRPPDPIRSYAEWTTALRSMLQWPNGFYEFMIAYRLRHQEELGHGLYYDLGTLYSTWLEERWQHPAFQFVQDAFEQYLVDTYTASDAIVQSKRYQKRPELARQFAYTTIAEAARLLHVTPVTIHRLIECGRLHVREFAVQEGQHRYRYILRADVLDLKQRWSETATVPQAADLLGVSKDITTKLIRLEILRLESGSIVDGHAIRLVRRSSIREVLDRITQRVSHVMPPPGTTVSLYSVGHRGHVTGLTTAKLLNDVLNGHLPAYRPRSAPANLSALRLRLQDIRVLAHELRFERGKLTRQEVAQRIGVKVSTLAQWEQIGVLAPDVRDHQRRYYDRAVVERFIADHIFAEEAAEILGVGVLVVQKWARAGRLKPVSGPGRNASHRYLFRRGDVELLRPENRLTAPQMAKRLGISRSQLHVWIREGKVQPVSGPGIDDSGHYLFNASAGL